MAKGMSLGRGIAAGLVLSAAAGCAPIYQNHGYVPADSELSQVKVGEPKADVEKQIGSPSMEGLKNDTAWYYVQSRWRTVGAFPPREIDRQVVAVSFTPAGNVANVERFGLERGEVVTISQRVTTSTVKGIGLLQQLFNDLGRFNPGQFLNRRGG